MRSCIAVALAAASSLAIPSPAQAQTSAIAHGIEVKRGSTIMRVTAIGDAILRVRVAKDGVFPEDASWAVAADVRARTAPVRPTANGFATAAMRVAVDPATLRMTVTDPTGQVITSDTLDPLTIEGKSFTLRKAMPQAEHYFGLGDKTGGLDRRGKSFVDWNTDAFGFSGSDDPIYKSIPFFIGVGGPGGSYGLFLDNSWRSWFDFGHRDANVLAFGAHDGPIDYYLIAGPSTAEVVRRYTDLTGKAPLQAQWALGYQQSRYSYMSADETKAIAARLRSDRIPTDVIWLDIDFQDRNRPFTVNPVTFPDLKGMVGDLGKDGFKVVTITDLHVARAVNQGYRPYDEGAKGDHFVHNPDGSVYVAPVWPGPSVFPDFTRTATRDWYGTLFRKQVDDGIAGAWNDMNEPAIFDTPTKTMPLDIVHRIDGDGFAPRTGTHAELHNVYGMQNTRATYEGLRKLQPNERAFVMTRASYAGGQRYAVTWTGDNSATWDHLKLSVQQIINMGLSGFSYGAADVSGFAGGPSPDLLTRWFEIGAFYPVFRNHSAKGMPRVEPWVDGPQHLAIRRRFIEERYRLMPYLYGLTELNARTGDPILRPVFYDYPSAMTMSCDQSMTFTLGKGLLVAPPPKPESPQAYEICLPAGGWYDYWTGKRAGAAQGDVPGPVQSASQATGDPRTRGDVFTAIPRLDQLPVFVRAGTILPRQPLVQSTAETPAGPLSLDVYPGADCRGDLYADDGHSTAFQSGAFLRQTVRCTVTPKGLTLDFEAPVGRYVPWWKQFAVTVHGWTGASTVSVTGRAIASAPDPAAQTASFTIPAPSAATRITIARR
ncbi:TIM-barrel domain-containing protein [Sphingomonas sp. R86521]|uniref:glycoside hydrolase family 31 protein n=1 Tax=Sphingomonas sp. R86521 TaxID=3093860 RepID=UPI0036D24B10